MNTFINLSHGSFFPKPFLYLSYVAILIGIIFLFENVFLGISIIVAASIVAFTPCGIQINTTDKLYREYVSLFGIKTGTWKTLKPYQCISILGKQISETTYGGNTPISTTTNQKYYDLYLLPDTPAEKILLKRFKDVINAKDALKNLSGKLGIDICD